MAEAGSCIFFIDLDRSRTDRDVARVLRQQYVGDRIIDVFGHRAVDDLNRVSLGDRRAGQYVERPEIRRFERIVVGRGVERELHPETFACRDDHRGVGAESNLVGSCCGADEDYET